MLLASGCTSVTKISEPGQTPVLEFQLLSFKVRLPVLVIGEPTKEREPDAAEGGEE